MGQDDESWTIVRMVPKTGRTAGRYPMGQYDQITTGTNEEWGMGFLSGRLTFERFQVEGDAPKLFGDDEIAALQKFAIGQIDSVSPDGATAGFLGGRHLFDTEFSLEKNVVN